VLIHEPREVLARYFDDSLVALILADRQCAVREREPCKINFSPLWDSQDPAASDLQVRSTPDSTVVAVSFRRGASKRAALSFRMRQTARGWRISDITYEWGSLLALLTA
jgi:hypothetical protein